MGRRVVFLLAATLAVSAMRPQLTQMAGPPVVPVSPAPVQDVNGNLIPPYDVIYEFDQLVDHHNPTAGTFKMRYYHTWEFYVPGGPIIIFPPGELNMEGYQGYLTNRTIPGRIAQENGGAVVVLEHRFFGWSNPKPDLSDKSLELLSIEQSIEDMAYFAKNVRLPMPGGDQVAPGKAPWVIVGGSYSGALVSWVLNTKSEFWAGYSSSGVVQAQRSNWGYTEVIRQSAAKNCTADVQRVIDHVDRTFTFGTPAQITALKANWNLANITHLDDVASTLRYNLWRWQDLGPTSGRDAWFHRFCDALEVKDGISAGSEGWGLEHALKAWGTFFNETYYEQLCGDGNAVDCLGSYDPTQDFWHDTSLDQNYRSWTWLTCQEIGYSFDGAPLGWPTLTSRLMTPSYSERQCTYYFNQTYAKGPRPANTLRTNLHYKGWFTRQPRVFFANGQKDPWREATMATDFVPSALLQNPDAPIAVAPNGYHCTDLITRYGALDAGIKQVQDLGTAWVGTWLRQWHAKNPAAPAGLNTTASVPDPRSLPKPNPVSRTTVPQAIVDAAPAAAPSLPVGGPTSGGGSGGAVSGQGRKFKVIGNAMIQDPIRVD